MAGNEVMHTPGPWRWELNLKHKSLSLNGGNPKQGFGAFDLDILQFRRWGMSGATAYFRNEHNIMVPAASLAKIAPGREHHAGWFQLLSHPDADLIAAAPDLLAACRALLPEGWGDDNTMDHMPGVKLARAALRKALSPSVPEVK